MLGRCEKPEELPFYRDLLLQIYQELAFRLHLKPSSVKCDIRTITERVASQGIDFLTKSLPSLGKCLDKALSRDTPLERCPGFKMSVHLPYPLLFRELWERVFDAHGEIKLIDGCPNQAVVDAIKALRQVTYLFYKLEGSHNAQSEIDVIDTFVSTDQSLPDPEGEVFLGKKTSAALESARILMHYIFKGIDLSKITPGHGPGAVSTGEKSSEKMNFRRIYESVEKKYPFVDYFFLNYSHLAENLESLDELEEVQYGTAKVVLVPKDSRGPRLISMEPLELQWIQQGQMRVLVRKIEQDCSLTSGYVNFTSQDINRDLALTSSYTQEFVTLDMKEASDRVSLWLIRKLFPSSVREFLESTRSQYTVLPSGARLKLRKFAPMGSSCCFPVEAITFWALAVGALRNICRSKDLYDLPPVYVYGDDIIMHPADYEVIRPVFEELSLLFNDQKCCTGRFFRESCGMDAFYGIPVTPLRIRTRWSNTLSPAATISYVSYVNNLRRDGYPASAEFICKQNTKVFGRLPLISASERLSLAFVDSGLDKSKGLATLRRSFRVRYNADLQRDEVKLLVPYSPVLETGSPDWGELFRSLIRMGPPDPFGLRGGKLDPCCYPVPHQIKMRWSWIAIDSLFN